MQLVSVSKMILQAFEIAARKAPGKSVETGRLCGEEGKSYSCAMFSGEKLGK